MHPRAAIRARVKAIMESHPDLANLFVSRGRPVSERKAPYARVMINQEAAGRQMDFHSEKRTLDVKIQLVLQSVTGADDALDALAETTENLMAADPTLNNLAERHEYQGTAFDFEAGAQADLVSAELSYSVQYIYEPASEFDDFVTAAVGFDMASPRNEPQVPSGPDGQIDAAATIDDLNL